MSFVALLVLPVVAGAQTAYINYDLIPWSFRLGPRLDYPLFQAAFTSGSYFDQIDVGPGGTVYVSADRALFEINAQGTFVPITGFGGAGVPAGERVRALLTQLAPGTVAEDSRGNRFLGTWDGVYRLTRDGLVELYAALPTASVAVDGEDALYVLDRGTRVVRIAADGSQAVVAGTGEPGFSGDGGPATSARISASYRIALDPGGVLWIADTNNNRIRKVDRTGTISTVLETPSPYQIAVDAEGAVYFSAWDLGKVSRLLPGGAVETVLELPRGIRGLAVDSSGNLYVSDSTRVRVADRSGTIRTLAGCICGGEGGPAAWGRVGATAGLVRDRTGNTYFSDQASNMVRRIDPNGTLTTVAGNGEPGFAGDGGPAREARLNAPAGLAMDAAGNLYIADEQNSRIRRVTPAGLIETVAGNGETKFAGDGGAATSGSLGQPDGVAIDPGGNLYIADTLSHRIRKVTQDGIMHTVAGSDQWGTAGDGGPAVLAQLINPRSLALDAAGNLLITDSSARLVRRITTAGIMERVAGNGEQGRAGDGGPAIAAQMDLPWGIAVDAAGNVYIGDGYAIRRVDRAGTIRGIAGGPAKGLAVDASGSLWMATGNTVVVASTLGPPFPQRPFIQPNTIGNAATAALFPSLFPFPSAAVAPGEILTISGARLGTSVAQVRVLFDGEPVPVLGVREDQITAIAPYRIAGSQTAGITVEVDGVASNPATVAVLPAVPGLSVYGAGALISASALNQDGTRNGPGNPAAPGSVVALFGAGAGVMNPPQKEGEVVSGTLSVPDLPVSVRIGGRPATVLYAGAAPGLVGGVLQVNVLIPTDLVPAPVAGQMNYYLTGLQVGNAPSNAGYLWVDGVKALAGNRRAP